MGALERLASAACAERAVTVLMAVGVFDVETTAPAARRQTFHIMCEVSDLERVSRPGDHDRRQGDEPSSFATQKRPDNVTLAPMTEQIALDAGTVILPAPCPPAAVRPERNRT